MGKLLEPKAPASPPVSTRLIDAVWGGPPDLLPLWHGGTAPVHPGDRVSYYEQGDGALVIVAIAEAGGDGPTAAARSELADGDA